MDKEIALWATLRRLKSSGCYSWDEEDLAFIKGVVEKPSFAECLPLLTDRYVDYLECNDERKDKAVAQYESRKEEIDSWFDLYKPVLVDELSKIKC